MQPRKMSQRREQGAECGKKKPAEPELGRQRQPRVKTPEKLFHESPLWSRESVDDVLVGETDISEHIGIVGRQLSRLLVVEERETHFLHAVAGVAKVVVYGRILYSRFHDLLIIRYGGVVFLVIVGAVGNAKPFVCRTRRRRRRRRPEQNNDYG